MQTALRITFHGMSPSRLLEAAIQKRAENLERFYRRIQSCHVVVEPWSHRHRTGNLYTVRIDVTVPGAELAVGRDHTPGHADEDALVAIRSAFDEMVRLVKDHVRKMRTITRRAS